MNFITLESTGDIKYTVNKNQITFISINDKNRTVIQLSCGTLIEVKESLDFIMNS